MRVRIITHPPLPPLKAWFGIDDPSSVSAGSQTVADLKARLLEHLPNVFPANAGNEDLLLEVDGFQLLANSGLDIIRDGDLLDIKFLAKKSKPTINTTKRKLDANASQEPPKKRSKTSSTNHSPAPDLPFGPIRGLSRASRRKISPPVNKVPPKPAPAPIRTASLKSTPSSDEETSSDSSESSSSSETDSDSDDTDSDSDSDSTSDSDSSSEESSSDESGSSSDSSPSIQPSKPQKAKTATVVSKTSITNKAKITASLTALFPTQKKEPPKPTVPPGQGKTSTHDRNARRRKKRMSEKLASLVQQAGPSGQTSDAPPPKPPKTTASSNTLAVRDGDATSKVAPSPMITSLRNSNKKKGFRATLQQAYETGGKRILFDAGDDTGPLPADTLAPHDASEAYEQPQGLQQPLQTRLIPPSERADLPPNVFVTSVDVEADLWGGGHEVVSHQQSNDRPTANPANSRKKKKKPMVGLDPYADYNYNGEAEEMVLDYGEAEDHGGATLPQHLDWAKVKAAFDSYPMVGPQSGRLAVGTVLAWHALGIDAVTFTPQILLHLGEVVLPTPPGAGNTDLIYVKTLHDTGLNSTSVGFGGVPVDDDDGDEHDEEIQFFSLSDMKDWRIVRSG